MTKIGMGKK